MSKKLWLLTIVAVAVIVVFFVAKAKVSAYPLNSIVSCSPTELLSIICFAGFIDSANPCAFSVLLLTIGFLLSLETVKRKDILKIGGFFILGVFVVYLLIGLGLLKVFAFFGIPRFMSRIGAIVLIIFGMFEVSAEIFPRFPIKMKIPSKAKPAIAKLIEKGSWLTVFLLGLLVGLTEFPCTGGPYLVVLTLLHDKTTFETGFKYLLVYNLVFIIPLVAILFIASDKSLIGKIDSWRKANTKKFKFVSGIVMLALGLLILLL